MDTASQAPVIVAAWSTRFGEPRPALLHVHEETARWVTRQQAPVIIADFTSDPRASALGMQAVGSLLSVPLLARQQALGALTISSPVLNAFSQQHLQLVQMGADLGALAIFQARQLDVVAQQHAHQAILLELSRALAPTPNAPTIIGLTVSAIRRLTRCDEAVLFRYDADTQTLCGVAGLGTRSPQLDQARVRVSDPQSVTAYVAQQRRPLLYASGTTRLIGPATQALLAHRELALLTVPLVARERLWGVITLARAVPFQTGELRTLLTLSQMIAPALAQTRDARECSPARTRGPAAREDA